MVEADKQDEKRARIAGWVLVVAALASLPWLVLDTVDPVLSTGDGAIYRLTASAILEGRGYSYLGEPFVIRPPGMSILLIPLQLVVKPSTWAINFYVSLMGVAAVGLVYAFYRKRLGWMVAAGLSIVCWLNPGFRALSNEVMSDVPGVALLFGNLLLERWARAKPSPRRDLLLAISIGFSGYVRSVVLLLAPAIVLARLLRPKTKGIEKRAAGAWRGPALGLMLLIPILIQAPWMWRNANAERDLPVEHTLFHSYAVAMVHVDRGDPSSPIISLEDFSKRVKKRVRSISRVLNGRVQNHSEGVAYPLVAMLGVGCWIWAAIRRRSSAEFYAGSLLLLYSIYFGFSPRLVLPLYILLLGCVAEAILGLFRGQLGSKRSQQLVLLCLLALALVDLSPRKGWRAIKARAAENTLVAKYLEENFLPNEALGSDFGAHLALALDRPVYSLRWSAAHGRKAGMAYVNKYGLTGIVIDRSTKSGRVLGPKLEKKYGCAFELAPKYCVVRIPR